MTTSTDSERMYICPGETHPISRSVHLSRLAAFYPACRDCPLRTETGQLPRQTIARLQSTERRVERKSLFTTEGVRGAYLNEITRTAAARMAAALASLLWEESPLSGRVDSDARSSRVARPAVVVGYDERPSSPDIAAGVSSTLRRTGCQVIDIGLSTKPCFWFTIDHIKASAGIFVTGAGCELSWTGLDFVGRDTIPWSLGSGLDAVQDRLRQPHSRPTRQAGTQRAFQAFVPYEASLWKHFHALRPLKVVCACPVRPLRRMLERVFETLPCRLILTDVPQRTRNPHDGDDADTRRLSDTVRQHKGDLGVLIDDDAQRTSFCDERGRLLANADVTWLIADNLLSEHPGQTIALERAAAEALGRLIESAGGRSVDGGATLAEMSRAMRREQAVFGGGVSGRHWFCESFPTSDAVLTIARVLVALSHSDAKFSAQIRSAA